MKCGLVVGMALFTILSLPAFAQQAPEPLKQDQIMDLVRAGMDPTALVKLIHEHGLDFDLTDDFLQALRAAKAPDAVLQALREVKPQPLSRPKLLAMVAGGLPREHITDLVRDRGVSFYADDEYLKTLRLAGADDSLVAAVRAASANAAADLDVVTLANAEVYLDGQLQGHADAQGELAVKSVLGPHALKVSLSGKKDFEQTVSLTAKQTTKVEAHLEDLAPASGAVVFPYAYPGAVSTSPLVTDARAKASDCMTMVNIWNSKLQEAMSTRDFSHRGAMVSQINAVNEERVATYRSKLMPQLKDLQQKMLTELGRTSGEHLDYEKVQSAMQLIGVCTDLNSLSSQYQMKMLQPK
jgi:hypothetical protein